MDFSLAFIQCSMSSAFTALPGARFCNLVIAIGDQALKFFRQSVTTK
jgi:hypothetical protein